MSALTFACVPCLVAPFLCARHPPLTFFFSPLPCAFITVPGALPLVGNGSLPHVPFVLAEGDYDAPPEKLWEAMRAKKYVLEANIYIAF